ncbi:hypothetical protein QR042_21705 [Salmonella enterica]|uniref:ApeA N-terminal domain-containing protein n=3 Tax=Salmonella enterica TaxID=28901 RepID=A0A3Y2N8S9_SALET|nr:MULTISPECIES: hypothetical protein [Salmonella]EAB6471324.1 hypothetical protein [Salmonella enterica subsp. enterica]EBF3939646.1 hypothetical protein [Salmonella enterica subsp. enterica serovar Thompson]EBS1703265.1 hypothetical protein [Salmonella enterica subsp. enterica serovar Newport]ECI0074682.1 hypothetical protein [Salmonella enterica subsp. enterica serovar Montevideo]EDO2506312.1 hypothetical protein [Salmonella enterica subsp. enterica serovar Javiana]EEE9452347.1 hypothetica
MNTYESIKVTFFYDHNPITINNDNIKTENSIEMTCNVTVNNKENWDRIKIKTYSKKIIKLYKKNNLDIEFCTHYVNGDVSSVIKLIDCRIENIADYYSGKTQYYTFNIIPNEVIINNKAHNTPDTEITFYNSDHQLLSSNIQYNPSSDGNITLTKSEPVIVKLNNDEDIKLDIELKPEHNEKFEINTKQTLKIKSNNPALTIDDVRNNYIDKIDAFNDILSFINSNKIVCRYWKLKSNNGVYTVFRCRIKNPIKDTKKEHLMMPLQAKKNIENMFHTYLSSHYRQNIRLAINILNASTQYLESRYLSLFQSFESIILTHKEKNNTTFILCESEFKSLKQTIERVITKDVIKDSTTRGKIKNKLRELNRISLKDATQEFLKEHLIHTHDLWPLFNESDKLGLSEIRNIIIHGVIIPSNNLINIAVACEHLTIYLTRLILCLLGCDHRETIYSEEHLNFNSKVNDFAFWEHHRKSLTEALKTH